MNVVQYLQFSDVFGESRCLHLLVGVSCIQAFSPKEGGNFPLTTLPTEVLKVIWEFSLCATSSSYSKTCSVEVEGIGIYIHHAPSKCVSKIGLELVKGDVVWVDELDVLADTVGNYLASLGVPLYQFEKHEVRTENYRTESPASTSF